MNIMETKQQLDIDQIWEQFHKTHDEHCRNLLLEHYRKLVRYTADRLHSKLPDKFDVDDLISAGTFGLSSQRVRGSMLDELRSMDWVPRLVRARAHQLSKATQSLETHLGRKPTEKETAKSLKLTKEEFTRIRRDANAVSIISLNTNYSDSDGEKEIREIDIVKDSRSKDPLTEAQKNDLKSLLTKGLTRAERLIVVLYYYEEMTMKEIGATLDLSESRVSQMHSSIIARLKAQMNHRKREFSV
jgi:RNA polymerase sigma factor for flagellar operon FliA